MKMLGLGENFGLGRFCVLHLNFPPKIWNFSGSGENFRFRQKLWVWVKILGLGENVGFVRKFWVRAKILGLGKNFRIGLKF